MDGRRVVADTSVFIKHFRATKKEKTALYQLTKNFTVLTASVVVYELLMGATTKEKTGTVEGYLEDVKVLLFDERAARKAAEIYHQLRLNNKMIEFRDIFIAAIYIVNNLELATLNKKYFERIDGLSLLLL